MKPHKANPHIQSCNSFNKLMTCCSCLSLQEKLMGHLGVVLYEYLGEEYPEVLGSILGALKAIVNVIGTSPRIMNYHCNTIVGCLLILISLTLSCSQPVSFLEAYWGHGI